MHSFTIFFLLCCFFHLHSAEYLVNRSVINLYSKPTEETDVVSQAIYAAPVNILQTSSDWLFIETQDLYKGWIHTSDIYQNHHYLISPLLYPVKSLFAHIYRDADTATYKPLTTLTFSSLVQLTQEPDASSRWLQVRLIDGTEGWIQRGDLDLEPRLKSLKEMLALSRQFLGLPYTWGGTSSYGYDCSEFVQMLYKQMGILLPRDSYLQADSPLLTPVSLAELLPGDLLFFGESKITHVGIYLANDEFINAGVRDSMPRVTINTLQKTSYRLQKACRLKPIEYQSSISEITPEIRAKLTHSWNDCNPVALQDLRYLNLRYWGYDGCIHDGEMIVHATLAHEVTDIFRELFQARYPIEQMRLIDAYKANDDLSMADNNTSAFCSRMITGTSDRWSNHSYGTAIDINPLLNPYVKNGKILPKEGKDYLDRSLKVKGLIQKEDACCQAFLKRGWGWGGNWMATCGYLDYQHFDKVLP